MLRLLPLLLLAELAGSAASAQPPAAPDPDWQSLALRTQQNATVQQMLDNGMLTALQAENGQLKAELAKLRAEHGSQEPGARTPTPTPSPTPSPTPGSPSEAK